MITKYDEFVNESAYEHDTNPNDHKILTLFNNIKEYYDEEKLKQDHNNDTGDEIFYVKYTYDNFSIDRITTERLLKSDKQEYGVYIDDKEVDCSEKVKEYIFNSFLNNFEEDYREEDEDTSGF